MMAAKFRGVMQSPVTPLKDDYSLDLPTFEKVLDFHVRTGAPAISWPHHKGESLSLTIPERKRFAEATVKVVAGRVPVTIHVSALAVEDTMELAQHAQKIGADGILAITPYFWTPTREAIHDYFIRLCTSIELPVLSYNSPSYLAGVEITGELMSRLIEKLPNFVGVKEASFNSEKFLEISRAALFDACIAGEWAHARELQYKMTRLWHLFKDQYPSSLKGGMVLMGRPVGPTRPPLPTATKERQAFIEQELADMGILDSEPHGW